MLKQKKRPGQNPLPPKAKREVNSVSGYKIVSLALKRVTYPPLQPCHIKWQTAMLGGSHAGWGWVSVVAVFHGENAKFIIINKTSIQSKAKQTPGGVLICSSELQKFGKTFQQLRVNNVP